MRLAYLRVIAQGDDDLAFERIINKPKRGLGDATIQSSAPSCARAEPAAAPGSAADGCDRRAGGPDRARRLPI